MSRIGIAGRPMPGLYRVSNSAESQAHGTALRQAEQLVPRVENHVPSRIPFGHNRHPIRGCSWVFAWAFGFIESTGI
jgi:hypothetical protein